MLGSELRVRLDCLKLSRAEAAAALGLSPRGLFHQMSGERPVSRQTELLLEQLEKPPCRQDAAAPPAQP
jgi:hypothetical protein